MALAIGALIGWAFGVMILVAMYIWLTHRKPEPPERESLQQRVERYSAYRRKR